VGEEAVISSSKNAQMSKNKRSEDVSVLSPRVYSVLYGCQESDNGGTRLKMVAKTMVMA